MIRRPVPLLVLLTGLNLLNYLDRLVVSAVLPKVQEELGLSNFVGGLLATIFLLGYFVTSPIFGWLADRGPRKNLVAIGVLLWSAATLASGLARNAPELLAARALVGVGEASYATLAPTLIDDTAPADKKGRYLSIFYVAMPVGSALGYLVGGAVEHAYGWRAAFFVAGGPGLLLAAVCLLIAEPARTLADRPSLFGSVAQLVRLPQFRRGVLGYSAYTAAIGAFSYWAPKFLYARYAMPLGKANFVFGSLTVVTGALGTAIGGTLADRLVPKSPTPESLVQGLLRICAVGSLVGAPLALAAFLSPSALPFFVFAGVAEVALFLSTSPINGVILRSVPVGLRGSAMALSIFAIHVLGDLWSPPFVGLLADHLPIAAAMMALPLLIAASGALWWPRAREAAPAQITENAG